MLVDLSLPLTPDALALSESDERSKALARLGHSGTHLDCVQGTSIPLEYMKGRALAVDVSVFCSARPVEVADLPEERIEKGDFIIFHTGALSRHAYGTPGYRRESAVLSWEVIDHLLERRVRFIGIDSRGIRPDAEHYDADSRCEQAGTFVIENMANTHALPFGMPFIAYALWFPMGGTGFPCRVVGEIGLSL